MFREMKVRKTLLIGSLVMTIGATLFAVFGGFQYADGAAETKAQLIDLKVAGAKWINYEKLNALYYVLVGCLFVVFGIFALVYSFGNNDMAQERKWPFIVMLIFGLILTGYTLWAAYKTHADAVEVVDQNAALSIDSFGNTFVYFWSAAAMSIVSVGSIIAGLVLVVKKSDL